MVEGAEVPTEPETSDGLKCRELGEGLICVESWCADDKYCVESPSCCGKEYDGLMSA